MASPRALLWGAKGGMKISRLGETPGGLTPFLLLACRVNSSSTVSGTPPTPQNLTTCGPRSPGCPTLGLLNLKTPQTPKS